MGADKGALVALQALGGVPGGQAGGDAALVILGSTHGIGAVLIRSQSGNRQVVAPLTVAGDDDVLHHIGKALVHGALVLGLCPRGGDLHLHRAVDTGVYGGQVHGHHLFALLGVGLLSGFFHVTHGIVHRHYVGELEESGLQDQVGVVAQTQFPGDLVGVHGIELDVVVCDVLLHIAGQMELQLRGVPRGIQQEGAAVLDLVDHIILGDIGLRMAGQEVGGLDQIGGADGALGEPQVALGDAVGLLGVILKVSLRIHTGVVADDLGGVLVRANSAVRAKTPEFAGHSVGRLGDQRLMDIQRQMGHIVHEADGEHLLGVLVLHVVIDGLDLGGRHIPAGNTVAAAIDGGGVGLTLQSRAGIQINGTADSAGLLGAVHGGDLLYRLGQGVQEILDVEGTEQVDLQQAHLLALRAEVIDDLFGALAGRAHHHDDPLGILSTIVVEDVVVAAGDLVDPLHVTLYDVGDGIVSGVVGFLALEIHVRALHGGAVDRVLRVHSNAVELSHGVLVQQFGNLV